MWAPHPPQNRAQTGRNLAAGGVLAGSPPWGRPYNATSQKFQPPSSGETEQGMGVSGLAPPHRLGSVQGCLRPSPGPEDPSPVCLSPQPSTAGWRGTSASLGVGGHRDGTLGFLYSSSGQGAFVGWPLGPVEGSQVQMAKREGPHPLACFLPLQMRQLQPPGAGGHGGGGGEAAPRVPQPHLLQSLETSTTSSPAPEPVSSVGQQIFTCNLPSVQRSGTRFQQKQKTEVAESWGGLEHGRTQTRGP